MLCTYSSACALYCAQLSKKNQVLTDYLSDREVVDVLRDFTTFQCSVEELVSQLRPLQPRYYSIASSPIKVKYNPLLLNSLIIIPWSSYIGNGFIKSSPFDPFLNVFRFCILLGIQQSNNVLHFVIRQCND